MNGFPGTVTTVGKKVEYLSNVLLVHQRFDEYVNLYSQLLDDEVQYIDPVHQFAKKEDVLQMLARYVPRSANGGFEFDLLVDEPVQVVWRWKICLKIRFTPFRFTIHGLVHARINPKTGKIAYQREYYDPMESIEVVPVVGWFYKQMLRMG